MTGFGAVTSEVSPQPAAQGQPAPAAAAPVAEQPAPAATVQTAPGVVSAFEGSIDERLNKLLG